MPLAQVPYAPNVVKDDPDYAARGSAVDSDKIRWVRGAAQAIGGWSVASNQLMEGLCRGAYAYSLFGGTSVAILGTNTKLYAFDGSRLWNITPMRSVPRTLPNNPFTSTADPIRDRRLVRVNVRDPGHGAVAGDTVYISNTVIFDNLLIAGTRGTQRNNPFTVTRGSNRIAMRVSNHNFIDGDTIIFRGPTANNPPVVGGIPIGGTFSRNFAANWFTVIDNSEIVTVTLADHGLFTGETITITNTVAVGGITPNGDYVATVVDDDTFTIALSEAANADGTGGTAAASFVFTRTYTIIVIDEDTIAFEHPTRATESVSDGGGNNVQFRLSRGYIIVDVIDEDNYTIEVSTAGIQFGTTGGGNLVEARYELNIGLADGTGSGSYGLGGYGEGVFGLRGTDDNQVVNPRTWSIDNRGEFAYCNPIGGTVYEWTASFSRRATPLANAPERSDYMIVTEEGAVMCFGCTSNEGVFQPTLIRYSDSINVQVWQPGIINLAGDLLPLQNGQRLVAAAKARGGILVWTDTAMFVMAYTAGAERPYDIAPISSNSGLIGPNAFMLDDGDAVWISAQRSFFVYRGGAPQQLPCPSRRWFDDNLLLGQEYKIWCSRDPLFKAATWHFPSMASEDNDLYLRWDMLEDPNGAMGWSVGTFDRTAWIGNNIFGGPLAVDMGGRLYFQEEGLGAAGDPIMRFVEWAPIDLAEGNDLTTLSRLVFALSSFDDSVVNFSGVLEVNVYLAYWPGGERVIKGPFNIAVGAQYPAANSNVIDLMAQARQMGMRVESKGGGDFWRLANIRADLGGGTPR